MFYTTKAFAKPVTQVAAANFQINAMHRTTK